MTETKQLIVPVPYEQLKPKHEKPQKEPQTNSHVLESLLQALEEINNDPTATTSEKSEQLKQVDDFLNKPNTEPPPQKGFSWIGESSKTK